jgi:adenosylmethionine-8-amino-7-oxononanoate aminotransferase
MYDASYLVGARQLCDQYQVHLIADEIAVGCGRTGTFFAVEQAGDSGIWPDFLALSKGISGGYLPLSLVMTTDKIYQAFYDDDVTKGFLHSHSYTGNPLACTAALATLDIFANDQVIEKNKTLASAMKDSFAWAQNDSNIEYFRQKGMILAFDVKESVSSKSFAKEFFKEALSKEILVRPIGRTIYIMPPYTLSLDELTILSNGIEQTLHLVLQNKD